MNYQEETLFNKIMMNIKNTKQKEPFLKMINVFRILPIYTKLATGIALIFGLSFGYLYNNINYNKDIDNKTCTYVDTLLDTDCINYW